MFYFGFKELGSDLLFQERSGSGEHGSTSLSEITFQEGRQGAGPLPSTIGEFYSVAWLCMYVGTFNNW